MRHRKTAIASSLTASGLADAARRHWHSVSGRATSRQALPCANGSDISRRDGNLSSNDIGTNSMLKNSSSVCSARWLMRRGSQSR